MNGILNVNKPPGKTSFDIVALVKRLSGERRVGHAGTLDPLASGVLPVCLGQATRVIEFLAESTKVYRAQIELGVVTDTYDAEGTVVERKDTSRVSREQVASALDSFRGWIQQVPPIYSALKRHGRPLYQIARSGAAVERASRPVEIRRLELVDWQPPMAAVEAECGKGVYIRSLAHDLGQMLGCGASLKGLVRTRYGPFGIATSISLWELEESFQFGYFSKLVHPLDMVLTNYPAVVVDEATANAIKNGNTIILENVGNSSICRAYSQDGNLLAVLQYEAEKGGWHPEKVFVI